MAMTCRRYRAYIYSPQGEINIAAIIPTANAIATTCRLYIPYLATILWSIAMTNVVAIVPTL